LQEEDIALCEAVRSSGSSQLFAFCCTGLLCFPLLQEEDIALCEAVQLGLQEPAYGVGRYAPGPEAPMYHYHSLLYSSVMDGVKQQQQQQQQQTQKQECS
jgi:hypothetical protein